MIELTPEQRQELSRPEPLLVDPETGQAYVLVRKEVYDRLKRDLDEEDARLMAPLLAVCDPEDWEDVSAYEGTL